MMILKKNVILLLAFSFCFSVQCRMSGENDLERLREKMIKRQIEARGVKDKRVLDAMKKVERHRFISSRNINEAYNDYPLPIGHGQTISQPYIVALMTELCELDGQEKILEIGTGSGYQAAVLSLLAKKVYTIEIIDALGKSAAKKLGELKYNNVYVRIGDGYKGWPEEAPFDVIILTASPPEVPEPLLEQLKDDGILVAPVGDFHQELIRIKKQNGKFLKEIITYVRFVPMIHGKEK
jgi:protein-L-isoaspartate(D-aspartate) O-methyltransferase